MDNLLSFNNVFIGISVFSTLLFILKLIIFIFTGGDSEVDADFTTETETETSFTFFSVQSILAFFMGFGWTGLAASQQFHAAKTLSILIAFIVGVIFMFFSAYLMFCVKKLNHTVKKDLNELTGKYGKSYTAFEANAQGQIQIDFNNKLTILDATNSTNEKINSFEQIKVDKIENNTVYISKV